MAKPDITKSGLERSRSKMPNSSSSSAEDDDRFTALERKVDANAKKLDAVLEALAYLSSAGGSGGVAGGGGGATRPPPPTRQNLKTSSSSGSAITGLRMSSVSEMDKSGHVQRAVQPSGLGSLVASRANSVDCSEVDEPVESSKTADMNVQEDENDIGEKTVVLESSDAWMINPKKRLRMFWDLGVILPIILYLCFMLPFRLSFDNDPVFGSDMYCFEFTIDMIFILDIFMNFRTGVLLITSDDVEVVEYNRWRVVVSYVKTWFAIDVVSGVPFAAIELILNGGGSGSGDSGAGALKNAKLLKLLRFLKLGRLLKIEKIIGNLNRDTLDRIEDFLQDGATRSAVSIFKLLFYMAYTNHILACGFVVVGKWSIANDQDTWLSYEIEPGPYVSEDTTGVNGDVKVRGIYVASFYFCLTTMTSVGFGDIAGKNTAERIFSIMAEFIAAIIFGIVIGSITAVVSSMDMNARKTAESLDAVSSFVAVRRFPENLGRRIRRHFRHFYSLKSAIDETKIFSDLSTPLRKEVSTYLVQELMGSKSFFVTLSETFWPRLLPLLRPMGFEKGEVVCVEDEECTEMYVVLTGMLVGVNDIDPQRAPRRRHIETGGSLNTLHLLGVWNECLETATAEIASETYAVSSSDFISLFKSDSEKTHYQNMQAREVTNFKMDPTFVGAPTSYGRPLYYSCFSSVEFTLLQTYTPPFNIHSRRLKNDVSLKHREMMVVVDLVHSDTSKPFNDIWRYRSARVPSSDFYGSSLWGETIVWNDINAPFHKVAIRMRVFETDGKGTDKCACRTIIALSDIRSEDAALSAGITNSGPILTPSEVEKAEQLTNSFPQLRVNEIDVWADLNQPVNAVPTQAMAGSKSMSMRNLISHGSEVPGAKHREVSVRLRLLASPPERPPLGKMKLRRTKKTVSTVLKLKDFTSPRASSDSLKADAMSSSSRSVTPSRRGGKKPQAEMAEMV